MTTATRAEGRRQVLGGGFSETLEFVCWMLRSDWAKFIAALSKWRDGAHMVSS